MGSFKVLAYSALAMLFAASGAVNAAGPIVSQFNADAEGFVGSTISTVQVWAPNGGNPGGHVLIRRDLSDPGFNIGTQNSVTPHYLGNYGTDGITGAGFDLNVFNTTLTEAWLRFRPGTNSNGWHFNFGAVNPNGNAWEDFDVLFNPAWSDLEATGAGWTQEAGADSFADTFASIAWIEVRAINPDQTSALVGIDNVYLLPSPSAGVLAVLAGVAGLGRGRRRPQNA